MRVAYEQERAHWDAVFEYLKEDKTNDKLRKFFELQLLEQGLFVEREISLVNKEIVFLKILCPFSKLMDLAESIRLRLPLQVNFNIHS